MEIKFQKKQMWYILLFVILVSSLIINLNVTLKNHLVFGDEGYYASRGEWTSQNLKLLDFGNFKSPSPVFKSYFLRPPFFIIFLSSLFMIGGEFLVKAALPVLIFLTGIMLFLFVKKVFSLEAGVLSAFIFLIIPSLITYSVLLYPEAFALFLSMSAIYLLYTYFQKEEIKYLISSCIIGSFAILTEKSFAAIFLFIVLALFLYKKNYKNYLKEVGLTIVLFFICLSPWVLIHNYYQFGNPGYNLDKFFDFPKQQISSEISKYISNKQLGTMRGIKTNILNMGVLNYINFAYTLQIFVLSVLGFSFIFINRNKGKKFTYIILMLIFCLNFIFTFRGESAARNTLGLTLFLSIAGGISLLKIFEYFKSFDSVGKMIGYIFILVIVFSGIFIANTKATSLIPKKQFSNSFFKGCDWIESNTNEKSRVMTLWAARAEYHCKRAMFGYDTPGMRKAVLEANNESYKIMKMHGIDYVFIQKFSISRKGVNRYPPKFVYYLENSPNFKKVYSFPQQCLYRRKISDCSVVYKVKEKEEVNKTREEIPQVLKSLQKGD